MTSLNAGSPGILLIGPYDPHCGEYTFLAPPLGVWRLTGVLEARRRAREGVRSQLLFRAAAARARKELLQGGWDVIGMSTTGMTLRLDLELAHLARRMAPNALIVAGGMEATFRPELMFELGPFDLVVLGEGERPLLELARAPARRRAARRHQRHRRAQPRRPDAAPAAAGAARTELRDAIFSTPYEKMPYAAYWDRLESGYQRRRAAQQGGTRGASGRDPFGAAHHAQLLPDGLHVLLLDELPASMRRAAWPRSRASTPTNACT